MPHASALVFIALFKGSHVQISVRPAGGFIKPRASAIHATNMVPKAASEPSNTRSMLNMVPRISGSNSSLKIGLLHAALGQEMRKPVMAPTMMYKKMDDVSHGITRKIIHASGMPMTAE